MKKSSSSFYGLNMQVLIVLVILVSSVFIFFAMQKVAEGYEDAVTTTIEQVDMVCNPSCCLNGNASELSCSSGCVCKNSLKKQGQRGGNNTPRQFTDVLY